MLTLIRYVLGRLILLLNAIFRPRPIQRSEATLIRLRCDAAKLSLYEFETCPFCVKVRRHLRRLSLPVETRDVRRNAKWSQELVSEGGRRKVPCLRIEEASGNVRWLYESKDIIQCLDARFNPTSTHTDGTLHAEGPLDTAA